MASLSEPSLPVQRGIRGYLHVCKANKNDACSRIGLLHEKQDLYHEDISPSDRPLSASKKRKRSATTCGPESTSLIITHTACTPMKRVKTSHSIRPSRPVVPIHIGDSAGSTDPCSLSTPGSTPTKIFHYHDFPTPTKLRSRSGSPIEHLQNLATRSPPNHVLQVGEQLTRLFPAEVMDMLDMHVAFLKALSLSLAHSGTAPIDVRTLLPIITQIWRKRAIELLDVRRMLGVLHAGQSHQISTNRRSTQKIRLVMFDYGEGRICIERSESESQNLGMASHLDEEVLHEQFMSNLQHAWRTRIVQEDVKDGDHKSHNGGRDFLCQLPLAPIPFHPSAKQASTLRDKGQNRLLFLRALPKPPAFSSSTTNELSNGRAVHAFTARKNSLLERIESKQALKSASTSHLLARKSLGRKAALHRLPNIIAMLSVLSGANAAATATKRHAFSLANLIRQIQDSSKSSLSAEEVDSCLRLLADEGARDWVRIVKAGDSVLGVVLDSTARPDTEELESWRKSSLTEC